MLSLIGRAHSGWTEKARWALDHHHVSYRFEAYTPVLEAPSLRARTRKWRGPTGVPVLLTPDGAIFDSFAIARQEFADLVAWRDALYAKHRGTIPA